MYTRRDATMLVLPALIAMATAALGGCAAPQHSRSVILVVIDGLRWQEVFTGADANLLSKEHGGVEDVDATRDKYWRDTEEARRQALMPFMWSAVAGQGQMLGNQNKGSIVQVSNPHRFSYPGYSEMLVGSTDPRVDSNKKIPNPNMTVLEWLNRQPELRGRVAAFGMWDVLPYILDREHCGFLINAGLEPMPDAGASSRTELLNRLKSEIPARWKGQAFDALMFHTALEYLKDHRPRVLYIAFGETDEWAHEGRYDAYLDAARQTDDWLRLLWDTVQSLPEYRNRTTLLVVADHGRGGGPEDWKDHGAKVEGAENVWIGIIGPDITPAGEPAALPPLTLAQTAATVADAVRQDYRDAVDFRAAPSLLPLCAPALR